MNKKHISLWVCFVVLLVFVACKSSKNLMVKTEKSITKIENKLDDEAFSRALQKQVHTQKGVVAKAQLELFLGEKTIEVGGQLKMKRDEVIQLSVSYFGMEVGRLLFTPEEVLLINKLGSEYVRTGYDKISFLGKTGLDFYAVQSLFWNDIFVPKKRGGYENLNQFQIAKKDDVVELSLLDFPLLNYIFTTQRDEGLLLETQIQGKQLTNPLVFKVKYEDFNVLEENKFPAKIQFKIQGVKKNYGLTLRLNKVEVNADWEKNDRINSKYVERNIEDFLNF